MDSSAMLEMTADRFRKGLWQMSGWGGENGLVADRRCIVGTLRWVSGTGANAQQSDRVSEHRSPWFFAYEEGVFEVVSILFEDEFLRRHYGWDEYVKRHGFNAAEYVRKIQKDHDYREHEAILNTLELAEGTLISYNDGAHSSTQSMIKLVEKALKRVQDKRKAIAEEYDRRDEERDKLASVNPDVTVVASRADEVAAREEYEAVNGQKWDPMLYDADGNKLSFPLWNWSKKGGWVLNLDTRKKVTS